MFNRKFQSLTFSRKLNKFLNPSGKLALKRIILPLTGCIKPKVSACRA